jgi:hypothetical protein
MVSSPTITTASLPDQQTGFPDCDRSITVRMKQFGHSFKTSLDIPRYDTQMGNDPARLQPVDGVSIEGRYRVAW